MGNEAANENLSVRRPHAQPTASLPSASGAEKSQPSLQRAQPEQDQKLASSIEDPDRVAMGSPLQGAAGCNFDGTGPAGSKHNSSSSLKERLGVEEWKKTRVRIAMQASEFRYQVSLPYTGWSPSKPFHSSHLFGVVQNPKGYLLHAGIV